MDNLGLSTEHRPDASQIVSAISLYVAGQLNESVERKNFQRRSQQPGESFHDFLVSLRELAIKDYQILLRPVHSKEY